MNVIISVISVACYMMVMGESAVISTIPAGDVVHETKESHKVIITQAAPGTPSVTSNIMQPAKKEQVPSIIVTPPVAQNVVVSPSTSEGTIPVQQIESSKVETVTSKPDSSVEPKVEQHSVNEIRTEPIQSVSQIVELTPKEADQRKPNLAVRTSVHFSVAGVEKAREILKTLEGLNLFEHISY